MLTESLRHLLSTNMGKILLDKLAQLFHQTFGHLAVVIEDTKIQEWIRSGNILSVASQVVHLNNNKWLVWAPGAYQYPRRRTITRPLQDHVMMTGPTATVTTWSFPAATDDNLHILHGHNSISSSSVANSNRPTTSLSASHGKRISSGMKKNMAIKFPSAATTVKAKEDIPPLVYYKM